MLFFRQIKNPFYLLLFVSGILSVVVYLFDTTQPVNLYLGIAIILAALLYCLMSFWEEKRSLKVIRGFAHLLPEKCIVRRQGTDHEVFAEGLVVGDLVWVRNGDKVNFGVLFQFPANEWRTFLIKITLNEKRFTDSSRGGLILPIESQAVNRTSKLVLAGPSYGSRTIIVNCLHGCLIFLART